MKKNLFPLLIPSKSRINPFIGSFKKMEKINLHSGKIYLLAYAKTSQMEYLVILAYESDTERKRIDYAIERWKDKTEIVKPKGTTIIFKGSNIDAFLDDLYSRIEIKTNIIEVYNLSEYTPQIAQQITELNYKNIENLEFTKKFLEYLLSKMNASYESGDNNEIHYTVNTKKGQGKVILTVVPNKERINVRIEGYGEFNEFVTRKIDEEMKAFLGR